ncbi:hypothetical protein [Phenylobacterium parvum]|uniref:DUF4337 domain-containing protein n=1 Tax=Phenylobacterium parvum TaxID=2201350 RepID=A0A2Z3HP91_9CAUL|nr:hypothetical protein [Phenylobacterium parvum]AWM77567.1 hypothetical protein HYN04_07220 [Phenylobacterium parvum]
MADPDSPSRNRRLETVASIMLAAAGVASAWATYQSSLWGGIQASSYATGSARVTEAARLELQAGQKAGMDTALYMAWLSAAAVDDRELMTFYERRFAPGFRKVFAEWRAQYPEDLRGQVRQGPAVPLPRAEHPESREASRLREDASNLFSKADKANATGDRYVASTVILALILFLLGISTVARSERQRRLLVILAGGLGVAVLVFLLRLPVASL